MKKNSVFFAGLVCILAVGMALAACDTTTGGVVDTWSKVTRLSQLDGTWKGSVSQTKPVKELIESQGPLNPAMEFIFGSDLKVTMTDEITITIDAVAETSAGSNTLTLTFTGSNILVAWPIIKEFFAMSESAEGIIFNNENHSIAMTTAIPKESIDEKEFLANDNIQINQDGTAIKIRGESSEEAAAILGVTEVILLKQ